MAVGLNFLEPVDGFIENREAKQGSYKKKQGSTHRAFCWLVDSIWMQSKSYPNHKKDFYFMLTICFSAIWV